jgi:hypothetical protein
LELQPRVDAHCDIAASDWNTRLRSMNQESKLRCGLAPDGADASLLRR